MFEKILFKLVLANQALAQTGFGGQPGSQSGFGGQAPTKDIATILKDLIGFSVGLGLTIASLMIIYAAYQMLTAGGNSDQFESGKKTIVYAIVGIIVLLLSSAIISLIRELLGIGS